MGLVGHGQTKYCELGLDNRIVMQDKHMNNMTVDLIFLNKNKKWRNVKSLGILFLLDPCNFKCIGPQDIELFHLKECLFLLLTDG